MSGSVETARSPSPYARYFAEDGHIFATSDRENLLVSAGDAADALLLSAIDKGGWQVGLPSCRRA
ncbi:hypothetical protein EN35_33915 [Rhodococcus qingshengii]|nr:hypothetical protein EN35_33915 [Rhodococcus qingshengii]